MSQSSSPSLRYTSRTFNAELANQVLQTKRLNRPLNKSRVLQYTRVMQQNDWNQDTGEALKYDKDGRLCDGQTRLAALAQCPGVELTFSEVWGLSDEAILHLDQGQTRSEKQTAMIAGVEGVTDYTFPTLKLLFINCNRRSLGHNWLSRPERYAIFEEYQDALLFASRKMRRINSCFWRVGVAKVLMTTPDDKMEEMVLRLNQYMQIVDTGVVQHAQEDVAAVRVRNYCMSLRLKAQNRAETWRAIQRCDYGLRAFLQKDEISRLVGNPEIIFPTPLDNLRIN